MNMTKKEAIRIAQGLITDFKCESETMVEFCNVVIKALEQDPILDKIRAEIDEQYERIRPYNIYTAEGLEFALEIIDKYKAESEEI